MSMLGMGRNWGQPYHPPNLKVNRYYHSRIGNRTHVEAPPRQKTTVMNFSYFFPSQSNQLLIICGVVFVNLPYHSQIRTSALWGRSCRDILGEFYPHHKPLVLCIFVTSTLRSPLDFHGFTHNYQ